MVFKMQTDGSVMKCNNLDVINLFHIYQIQNIFTSMNIIITIRTDPSVSHLRFLG